MNEVHRKVTGGHLSRDAYLYVRQSTVRQVYENTESTRRQYALRERAVALGWPAERVVVIDTDLGRSGADRDRDGFQRLVAEVGMGRAGIVLGLEVSRLARNSTDWHRLLEICALSDTLILDEDGIYDPGDFNDRLLLGLLVHLNRIDHPAHLDQLLPVPAVAGEPRHFPGRHRADLAEADLRNHAVESGAFRAAGRRAAEIVVDDVDLREAQLPEPVAHRVLQRAALAVVQNLVNGRLADIQDRLAFQMMALDLVRHHRSPRPGAPGRSRFPLPRPGRRDVPAACGPSEPPPAAASGPADCATAACREVGRRPEDRTDPTGRTSGGKGAWSAP